MPMNVETAADLFIQFGKVRGPRSQLLRLDPPRPKPGDILTAYRNLAANGVEYHHARDAARAIFGHFNFPIPDELRD